MGRRSSAATPRDSDEGNPVYSTHDVQSMYKRCMTRYAVFVTGAPATGKSTVAAALGRALPEFALLQKDVFKEALYEGLREGEGAPAVNSRRLSDLAMELLWTVAARCPRVILEANFRTSDREQRERFQALQAEKIEVHCFCEPETAMRRFAARASQRHPAHTLHGLSREIFEESQAPFGLGPVMEVDTTGAVDLRRLAAQLRTYWPDL